jgi:hypothetical protein
MKASLYQNHQNGAKNMKPRAVKNRMLVWNMKKKKKEAEIMAAALLKQ